MESKTECLTINHSDASSTSNSSNGTCPDGQTWSFEFSVIVACIMSISAFCAVVGNIMVLMVIIRHRGMRTRTNLFLLNLAVTDLLVGLFVVPFSITTLIENTWVFGEALCKLNGWMNAFCLIASFHTLMYISIHKYFSIVRPLNNPLKLNYIIGMMAAAWLWAAFCATLTMFVLEVTYKPGTSQCGPKFPSYATTFIVHGLLQFTVLYIPAGILIFCYVRMFVEIKKHSQRLRTNSTVEEDFILSQQKKVTMTLFIVLATFVMMALPYHLYATYTTMEPDKTHFPSVINPLAYMFLFLSSMCNPIIYAFRSPAFREGYKEILCQTPNYVVSDESEQAPRSRRLSSLISSMRQTGSVRTGKGNVIDYADDRALTPEAADKHMKPRFHRQKSLFELLRSTRLSTEQSVVHRNGDIIIMKGGKIVSVRKGGEGSHFLERLKAFKETHDRGLVSGLADTGGVMFGLVCEGVAGDNNGIHSTQGDSLSKNDNSPACQKQMKELSNEKATNDTENSFVSSNSVKHYKYGNNTNINFREVKYSELMDAKTCTSNEQSSTFPTVNSSLPSNKLEKPNSVKTVVSERGDSGSCGDKKIGMKNSNSLPHLLTSSVGDSSAVSSLHSGGIVIHVDDDDDILSVMPLTPQTKEYLAKSDVNISETDLSSTYNHRESFMLKAQQLCLSSDHVFRKPPSIQRLPSLEFLDPPIHLFRSHSNVNMQISNHTARFTVHRKKEHSQSSDVGSSSKSLSVNSMLSSQNKVTYI